MTALPILEQKIQALLIKKQELEHKQAEALYKRLKSTLNDDFCPALVCSLIDEAWGHKTEAERKEWRTRAEFFRDTRPAKTTKGPPTDPTPPPQI